MATTDTRSCLCSLLDMCTFATALLTAAHMLKRWKVIEYKYTLYEAVYRVRSIYISQILCFIELALFVASQSGLLRGNPDQFRTILLKKVRFRTKVRENRTIW